MKVLCVAAYGASHHQIFNSKLCRGIEKAGDEVTHANAHESARMQIQADVVVAWGWRTAHPFVDAGAKVLVADHGSIARDDPRYPPTTWLGWNGLNGRAVNPPPGGPERFERLYGDLLRPWNPVGDYALLIGQCEGDAAMFGTKPSDFYRRMVGAFRKKDIAVRFRPHPFEVEHGHVYPVEGATFTNGSLDEEISGACVVATFSSSTAVRAVLSGKPTIALDRSSLAWEVCSHSPTILTREPTRKPWAAALAWRQWMDHELIDGSAWQFMTEHIR